MFSKSLGVGKTLRLIIFYISVLIKLSFVHAQSSDDYVKDHYLWFDRAIGFENSGLYNGIVYKEKHRMKDKNQKFFHSTEFLQGSIDYDGQLYFDVVMKYDVYDDQVLIKLNQVLLLKKAKIKSFRVDGHKFEKFDHRDDGNLDINGFFEVLFENQSFKFIKKHKKEVLEKYGNESVIHKFLDKNEYFLCYQNQYHRISSRGDIVKLFPDFAAKIKKQFSKSHRKLGKEKHLYTILTGVYQMMSEEKLKVIE